MAFKISLVFLIICVAYITEGIASPQYTSPYPGQPFQGTQGPYYSNPNPWQPNARSNFSHPNPNPNPNPNPYYYPNPNPQSYPDPLSSDIYRQMYGVPQPSALGYPQIYKVDNFIIIANPPQQQPQPCIPQPRPPPTVPNPNIPNDNSDKREEILNRMPGDEPSKCTWAIVACCSPNNLQVRYNCFELLGCPGFFFDDSPCEPKIVMAAANAALEFYRSAGNNSASSGSSDTSMNRL